MLKSQGHLNASQLKIALVVSQDNERVTSKLLEGALRCLRKQGISDANLHIAYSPGNSQLPVITQALARQKKCQAILCLAAFIENTPEQLAIRAKPFTDNLQSISLQCQLPVVQASIATCSSQESHGTIRPSKGECWL